MLESCKSAKERWGGLSELIDSWLNARQNIIVLYCSMNGVNHEPEDDSPLQDKLRHFCQLLVDYVSTGHFEIYEQLEREALDFGSGEALLEAQKLFQALKANTGVCLDFNDRCEKLGSINQLQSTLSAIGETLEERFAMEDKLVTMLHSQHGKDLNWATG